MGKIAIITRARLEQSQGAPGKSLLVNIDGHGIDNAEFYQIPGIYNRPQDEVRGLVFDCNGNNIVVAAHDYNFDEAIEKGETLIYSYDSDGVLQGKILINASGEIVLNDGTDTAVKFSKLKEVADELQQTITDLKTAISGWTPVANDGGAALKAALSTWLGVSFTKDIDDAESDTVKLS